MRRIINSTYVSLDGVIEGPHLWPSLRGGRGERGDALQAELIMGCDAMLMGRRTYDSFAAVWPTRSGDPVSDRFNSIAKHVVSRTLRDPAWSNTSVIRGDVAAEVARLKDRPGGDIVQYGVGDVTYLLMDHGLLDEIRLWVHPLFVGAARHADLIHRDCRATTWDLADVVALDNGIVVLTYRDPAAAG